MASIEALLNNADIRAALRLAWRESHPGSSDGHEEGGPHPGCRAEGLEIIVSFHTHPNTGPDYVQEPSETDKRAVRDDPDLKAPHYSGELVISAALLYFVTPTGDVVELGETERILAQT
ncbi:MAG: hypothetical protein DME22_21155 [Verrucomicrobia bacterium]|nr:MAG: hypothetical protein DME22_21155 [Verrucomicrobiota bacterium]